MDRAGIRERKWVKRRPWHVDPDYREIGTGIGTENFRLCLAAVGEGHGDRLRAVDHVLVSEDVSAPVVDDAGALSLGALLAEAEDPAVLCRRGSDVDHARAGPAVELADRQTMPGAERGRLSRARLRQDCGRRRVRGSVAARNGQSDYR